MMDAEDEVAMQEDGRVHPDPAIAVADLEGALETYFSVVGYRNLQEIIETIREGRCTWKTAPKADGAYTFLSLCLVGVFKVF